MSVEEHRAEAKQAQQAISIAVVTVSDSRTEESDTSGQTIRQMATTAGHQIVGYRIVKDEPEQVEAALEEFGTGPAQILIFNGGTGISRRDRTYDVLASKLEKVLSGFGEIFRMLSYEEIGAAAMLSRATAGTYKDVIVISTPGSTNAVKLAMEKLILPEIEHLAWEVGR